MPIYTKTGDKGQTGLFSGIRVSKTSPRIEAIGTVDELNSVVGLVISQIPNPRLPKTGTGGQAKSQIIKELIEIKKDLFEVGSALANPRQRPSLLKRVGEFEKMIDKMTEELPTLFNFILPGGGEAGSMFHLARTVCRRAERRIAELSKKEKVQSDLSVYINRLSDLFLTMSRYINFKEGKKEIIWKG